MPRPIHFEITYGHDTEGNVFGMMHMDAAAK